MDTKRIIKANALRELGHKIVFNYEDFQSHCDKQLDHTLQQAQHYLTETEQQIVILEDQAKQRGYEAGYSDGMKQARDEIRKRVHAQTEVQVKEGLKHGQKILHSLSDSIVNAKVEWLSKWEISAIELCLGVAEKILRAELAQRPELSREMIREILELSSSEQRLIARVHPDDFPFLQTHEEDLVEFSRLHQTVEFRSDPNLKRGDCVVETDHGLIDGRVQTQLNRFFVELSPQEAPKQA